MCCEPHSIGVNLNENEVENLFKCFKTLSNGNFCRFCWKVIPTLDLIISGTNCVRDKLNISAEKGGQWDWVNG